MRTGPIGPRPSTLLVLYDFEACPFCRRVREALTRLALPVSIRPCPKGGRRFRDELLALGGKEQVPFLVDPDRGLRLYESKIIVASLEAAYGDPSRERADPSWGTRIARSTAALVASGLGRGLAGSRARPSRAPERPLVLYGFEADPATRLVREVLCELELGYEHRPVEPGGTSADVVGNPRAAGAGRSIPRLIDPETGTEHVGFEAAIAHLERTYAIG